MYGFRGNIFYGLLGTMSNIHKEKLRRSYGITNKDGCDGVESLSIPHEYYEIKFVNGYFYANRLDGITTVFSKKEKLLFKSGDIHDCKGGFFLVQEIDKENPKELKGYCLCKESASLSEFIFRPRNGSSFNDQGFCKVGLIDDTSKEVIINQSGEIVYENNGYFDNIHLIGMLLQTKKGYLNLLENKYICEKGRVVQ